MYNTVGTVPKSKPKLHVQHCRNSSKVQSKTTCTTLSEQFQSPNQNYMYNTVGTVPKSKPKLHVQHCWNSSKVQTKTTCTTLSEQFQSPNQNYMYNTVGTVPKSNRKVIGRGLIHSPNTQIHDLINNIYGLHVLYYGRWRV